MKNSKLQGLTIEEIQSVNGGFAVTATVLAVMSIELAICALCYQIGRD